MKTLTLNIDENLYAKLQDAAKKEHRSVQNFLEWAALNYIDNSDFVSDDEMEDVLEFSNEIDEGIEDIKEGRIKFVK